MKVILLSLLLVTGVVNAAPNQLVFQCELNNGQVITVNQNPVTDVFSLSYGDNTIIQTINVEKRGQDIGTVGSKQDGVYHREIFFNVGGFFYTVLYNNDNGVKTGSFNIAQATRELTYQACKKGKVYTLFEEMELFRNMTLVD